MTPSDQGTSTVDIVQSPDLVGSGLDFEVFKIQTGIISATLKMVEQYIAQNKRAVHILYATKKDCEAFAAMLQGRDDVRVIHSDTPKADQAKAAKAWYKGKVTQLYTASLGTVGSREW